MKKISIMFAVLVALFSMFIPDWKKNLNAAASTYTDSYHVYGATATERVKFSTYGSTRESSGPVNVSFLGNHTVLIDSPTFTYSGTWEKVGNKLFFNLTGSTDYSIGGINTGAIGHMYTRLFTLSNRISTSTPIEPSFIVRRSFLELTPSGKYASLTLYVTGYMAHASDMKRLTYKLKVHGPITVVKNS